MRAAVLRGWRDSPTRFREDANAEEDLRLGGYRDRWLIELAQNAADAAGRNGSLSVSIVDGMDGANGPELRVANTGAPLSAAGVAALASLRASSKRDQPTVGRFGVGFAAVTALSEEPSIVSATGTVGFSAQAVREEVESVPALAAEVRRRDGAVPLLRLPYPGSATDRPPAGYTSEVRLPLPAGTDTDGLLVQARAEVTDLLLALDGLDTVWIAGEEHARRELGADLIELALPGRTQRWLCHRNAGELDPGLLATLGVEARARTRFGVCWAVPLDAEGAPQRLAGEVVHAPTPTEERLTLPARLLADLPLEVSRRRVAEGPVTDAVLAHAARTYPELLPRVPADAVLALVPETGFPASDTDAALREQILAELAAASWLPTAAGATSNPASAVALPAELAEAAPEVCAMLAEVQPGLLPAALCARRWRAALGALGVRTTGYAELAQTLAAVGREPRWWRRLYAALLPVAAADRGAAAELGALPVPLLDGRLAIGPRGVLLADARLLELISTMHEGAGVDLAIAHPDALDERLALLGARAAGPVELLESGELGDRVRNLLPDAQSGLDVDAMVTLVLRLVEAAGADQRRFPWLGELPLSDVDGELRKAAELVMPGAALLDVLDADAVGAEGPLGVLAAVELLRCDAPTLTSIGVLDGFAVLDITDPVGPEHELPQEADWWRAIDAEVNPPARMLAIRDLDLVADDAWPTALRLIERDPAAREALHSGESHPAWWIARHGLLAGRPPRDWRMPDAAPLAGLFPDLPALDLDERTLTAVGVRTDLVVASEDDAAELLGRLADGPEVMDPTTVLRVHRALADALNDGLVLASRVDPPQYVRAGTGVLIPARDACCVDRPWLLDLCGPDSAVLVDFGDGEPDVPEGTDRALALAELLDIELASERCLVSVISQGEPSSLGELSAVRAVCALLGVRVPEVDLLLHEQLRVRDSAGEHELAWFCA
ncbi:MAG: sacsin N-terminal ATP-binding-like domain-containing protein, partial [Sciscionella sp.]